jgi:hypothetical protein
VIARVGDSTHEENRPALKVSESLGELILRRMEPDKKLPMARVVNPSELSFVG